MQLPKPETITLDDILITEELSHRAPRPPNWQAEADAVRSLSRQLAHEPEVMLQSLVDLAVELCDAESAGVSLLETTPSGEEVLRWSVLAGTLTAQVGSCMPRNFSPCGVCLDQSAPILFSHPERYYTYFQVADSPLSAEPNSVGIVEALILPLIADGQALGAIWIAFYNQRRQFNPEDVRLMTNLADFTAALLRNRWQTQELLVNDPQFRVNAIERQQAAANLEQSEQALQQHDQLLAIAMEATHAGWGDWNWLTGEVEWSENGKQIMGFATDAEAQTAEGWLQRVHPEDRAQIEAHAAEAARDHRDFNLEYRIIRANGEIRWL